MPETSRTYSKEGRAVGNEANTHAQICSTSSMTADPPVSQAEISMAMPLTLGSPSAPDPVPAPENTSVTELVRTALDAAPLRARETLREKFRSLAKHLTRKPPMPSPRPRRRRREEGGRSFKAFAITLLRRLSRTPVFDPLDSSWNTFTWLQFWEYNHAVSLSQDCAVPPPSSVPQL
jgi:hypothetical protein